MWVRWWRLVANTTRFRPRLGEHAFWNVFPGIDKPSISHRYASDNGIISDRIPDVKSATRRHQSNNTNQKSIPPVICRIPHSGTTSSVLYILDPYISISIYIYTYTYTYTYHRNDKHINDRDGRRGSQRGDFTQASSVGPIWVGCCWLLVVLPCLLATLYMILIFSPTYMTLQIFFCWC